MIYVDGGYWVAGYADGEEGLASVAVLSTQANGSLTTEMALAANASAQSSGSGDIQRLIGLAGIAYATTSAHSYLDSFVFLSSNAHAQATAIIRNN